MFAGPPVALWADAAPDGRSGQPRLPCPAADSSAPQIRGLEEHPFVKVVAEYPWINIFAELGKMNNGEKTYGTNG